MTHRNRCLHAVGTLVLCCATVLASAAARDVGIYFPSRAVHSGKQFSSVLVAVSCAHFRAIASIPNDWYVQTLRPALSGDLRWKPYEFASEGLELGAGHGVSRLTDLAELSGAIRVTVEDASCF